MVLHVMIMNTTSGHFLPGGMPLGNPWEAWRLGWMASELWMASAYDILSRTHWLAGADPTQGEVGREWQRMWKDKLAAGLDVAVEVQRVGYAMWFGQFNPWQNGHRVLQPLRRRDLQGH